MQLFLTQSLTTSFVRLKSFFLKDNSLVVYNFWLGPLKGSLLNFYEILIERIRGDETYMLIVFSIVFYFVISTT